MANKNKVPQKLRRNERERRRVHQVNMGFNTLRDRVPLPQGSKQKLSKVETLREAARYIEFLRSMLGDKNFNACLSSPQSQNCSPQSDIAAQLQQIPGLYYQPMNQFCSQVSSAFSNSDVSLCSSSYFGSETSFEDKFSSFSQ